MSYGIGIIIVGFLHVLLKLEWKTTVALAIFVFLIIPFHQRLYRKSKKNEKAFYEVSLYLDTLLYSFVKEEKVLLAIQDVFFAMPPGEFKELVSKTLDYMNMAHDDVEVLDTGLNMIEKEYPCQRVKDVHQFMLHAEYYGGEIEKPVNILLADKGRWEQRVKQAMEKRKKQFVDVILSVVASLMICGAIVYLPVGSMDISKEFLVQLMTFIVIISDEIILYKAQKYICVDWLKVSLTAEDAYYIKKMENYYSYDEKREKRLSIVLGVISLSFILISIYFRNKWLAVLFMALTLFCFKQHQIGRALQRKTLIKEIKYAFPKWLLDLVLILQSENVYMALQKSLEHVPGVLRKEVQNLVERLEMEPESSVPYHLFLEEFHLPEIHSAMGVLYGLSIGNSANMDKQIGELVEKNLALLDVAETELWRESSSGMIILFLLPVVVASFKLIVDMLFLMLYFVKIPVL